jgi:TRAP transporter 4TM/12TM fusion protein
MIAPLIVSIGRLTDEPAGANPYVRALTVLVALTMAGLHLVQTAYFVLPSDQIKNLHLGLALVLVFLIGFENARPSGLLRYGYLILAAAALGPMIYIHLEYTALVTERIFGGNAIDVVVATALVGLALVAAYQNWGLLFTALPIMALLYAYFGYLLPGDLLFHAGIGYRRLMAYASIPYFQGMLGSLTDLSASLIIIFMLFVGLLKSTGGMDLVMIAGQALSGRSRSGPARLAIVSSGLMGMISGSTVANVASTGAITIKLMKRFGFRAEQAGAIEAVASTGGQFAPPIMGLTAFLIVGMTGIPYTEIMLAAVFPAIIYYAYLLVAVEIQVRSENIGDGANTAPPIHDPALDMPLGEAIRKYGHLVLGVLVLVVLLVTKLPAAHSALIAIGTIMATETLKQLWLNRRAPLAGLKAALVVILRGLDGGARSGAQLAIVIATIGILVDILVVTGFAQKLSYIMLSVAGDSLGLLLVMSAVACIVFGLGMPTPAAYILVALLGVPALVRYGVPELAAHMFVFYFANMSAITPPIAVAALVAAKIADADYMKTSFAALRLGLPGFILPFLFVNSPGILGLEGGIGRQLLEFATALIGVVALTIVISGFIDRRIALWQRGVLLGGVAALLYPSDVASLAGLSAIAVGVAPNLFASSFFQSLTNRASLKRKDR